MRVRRSGNEGFRMLEEFACPAIPSTNLARVPKPKRTKKHARNEATTESNAKERHRAPSARRHTSAKRRK